MSISICVSNAGPCWSHGKTDFICIDSVSSKNVEWCAKGQDFQTLWLTQTSGVSDSFVTFHSLLPSFEVGCSTPRWFSLVYSAQFQCSIQFDFQCSGVTENGTCMEKFGSALPSEIFQFIAWKGRKSTEETCGVGVNSRAVGWTGPVPDAEISWKVSPEYCLIFILKRVWIHFSDKQCSGSGQSVVKSHN